MPSLDALYIAKEMFSCHISLPESILLPPPLIIVLSRGVAWSVHELSRPATSERQQSRVVLVDKFISIRSICWVMMRGLHFPQNRNEMKKVLDTTISAVDARLTLAPARVAQSWKDANDCQQFSRHLVMSSLFETENVSSKVTPPDKPSWSFFFSFANWYQSPRQHRISQ